MGRKGWITIAVRKVRSHYSKVELKDIGFLEVSKYGSDNNGASTIYLHNFEKLIRIPTIEHI